MTIFDSTFLRVKIQNDSRKNCPSRILKIHFENKQNQIDHHLIKNLISNLTQFLNKQKFLILGIDFIDPFDKSSQKTFNFIYFEWKSNLLFFQVKFNFNID